MYSFTVMDTRSLKPKGVSRAGSSYRLSETICPMPLSSQLRQLPAILIIPWLVAAFNPSACLCLYMVLFFTALLPLCLCAPRSQAIAIGCFSFHNDFISRSLTSHICISISITNHSCKDPISKGHILSFCVDVRFWEDTIPPTMPIIPYLWSTTWFK